MLDWGLLYRFVGTVDYSDQISMDELNLEGTKDELWTLVEQGAVLAQKYDVVVTNPPYAGAKGLSTTLRSYLNNNYSDGKSDLFGAFIVRCYCFSKDRGNIGMVTPVSPLYNPSFQTMRRNIIVNSEFTSLVELGSDAFQAGFGTVVFSILKHKVPRFIGRFYDVSDENEKTDFVNKQCYYSSTTYFSTFDELKIMYKLNEDYRNMLKNAKPLTSIGNPRIGMQTNDNTRFIRLWHEVDSLKFCQNHVKGSAFNEYKWFPIVKGGGYRKWYGNIESVVNWQYDGAEIRELNKNAAGGRIVAEEYYFCEGLTWTHTTYSQPFSMRYMPTGTMINVEGPAIFSLEKNQNYILGCMNSVVAEDIFKKVVSSIHYSAAELGAFPTIIASDKNVDSFVEENVAMAKHDWDSYETSWDFKRNPLV